LPFGLVIWLNEAMTTHWADTYLARIGAARPGGADLDALRELEVAHLLSVPFENLSIHLGEPIVLEQAALVDKVAVRRRGGFCYELNGAFAALLTELGFRVSMLSARVYGDNGQPGPPFAHMALRVDLDEPWLVDVGFGWFAGQPLRLHNRGDQPDAGVVFRVADSPSGLGDLDILSDGTASYRIDPRPYALADFAPTCWYQATSPRSHFTRSLTCSIQTEHGRTTLSGDRLIVTADGQRDERTLTSEAEILGAYRHYFGIDLDQVPAVAAHGLAPVS
jgi:N-hydroxyarylamine O-acetyltransferase